VRRTYATLYRLGLRPWDSAQPPAPLVDLVERTEPGLAVDLGCGTGAQARYLAAHGWQVTAVDFVPRAIGQARQADPDGRVIWRVADVTRPSEVDSDGALAGRCDLVLDNGCLHGLGEDERRGWAATVRHLGAPATVLLLRAAAPRRGPSVGPAGIAMSTVDELLGPDWSGSMVGAGWYSYSRS
jgi:SAM-dependent methyltransferase